MNGSRARLLSKQLPLLTCLTFARPIHQQQQHLYRHIRRHFDAAAVDQRSKGGCVIHRLQQQQQR